MEPSLRLIGEQGGVKWNAIRTQEVSVPMKLTYNYHHNGVVYFNYLITTDAIYGLSPDSFVGGCWSLIEHKSLMLKLVVPLNNEELFYFDKYCNDLVNEKHRILDSPRGFGEYQPLRSDYIDLYLKAIELSQSKRSESNTRKEMVRIESNTRKEISALAEKDEEIASLRAELQSKDEEIASLRAELQSKDEEIASLRDLQAIDGDCRKPRNIDMQVELYEDYGLPSEMASELIAEQENTSNEAKRQEQYAKRLVPTQEAMSKVAEIMLTIKLMKIW